MRDDILKKKQDILKWIGERQSKAFICKQLNCKPETLNWWLLKMDITYEGNMGGKGIKVDPRRRTALEYIEINAVRSNVLKLKLIEEGYKENICEECRLTEWNGHKLPTELHHLDGDRFNNEFSNLQILCCNCHALTPNYKKKKSAYA